MLLITSRGRLWQWDSLKEKSRIKVLVLDGVSHLIDFWPRVTHRRGVVEKVFIQTNADNADNTTMKQKLAKANKKI